MFKSTNSYSLLTSTAYGMDYGSLFTELTNAQFIGAAGGSL